MSKGKVYAVKVGRKPGIYDDWADASAQVTGFSGAVHKSFGLWSDAEAWLAEGSPETSSLAAEPDTSRYCLYTDGSTNSWGWVLVDTNDDEMLAQNKGKLTAFFGEANAAAELEAVLEGLQYAYEAGYCEITVCHDYLGVANFITGAWKAKSDGALDYKETFERQIAPHVKVEFQHVKGHSGNKWNERADRLAASVE